MLIYQRLLEHGTRDERKHTIFTTFEDLWVFPLRLLRMAVLILLIVGASGSQCDRARVFRVHTLVLMDLEGALLISAAPHVMLVIHHHDA